MSKSLPTAPNLEHLKKQAKDLRKSHRTRNPECCATLRLLRCFANSADLEIFESKLSLNEAQMALALDYGFKSWGDLKKHVLGRTDNLKYLHIHSGESAAQCLRNSRVPGDCFDWREIYIEGPAPGGLSDAEFVIERAKYLFEIGVVSNRPRVLSGEQGVRDKLLAEAGKYEEVVLWFDACMFDQTMMIKVIDQCSHHNWDDTKFSLICVGEFEGFEKFNGIGELNPEQLESLMEQRHEITPEEISLAQNSWKAFTSANPADLEELLAGDTSALPYLRPALTRFIEQYPSVRNGLNRSENQVLQAVADGAGNLIEIFLAVSDKERPSFMGDSQCWGFVEHLAECRDPLLKVDGPGKLTEAINHSAEYNEPSLKNVKQWKVSITDAGKEVLSGRKDFIKLNGIDHWLGGVHLQGPESQWRWDEDSRKLVKTSDTKPVDSSFVNAKKDESELEKFLFSMADYLDKGIPLFQMLERLHREASSVELRNAIGDIIEEIRSGNTISITMERHKKVFPPTVISLIRDGERLGKLEITARKAAEWLRDGSYTMDEKFLLDDTRAAAIRQMMRDGLDRGALEVLCDPGRTDKEGDGPSVQSFRPILIMPDGKEIPWKMWILTKQIAEIERELKEQTLLDAKQSGDEMKGTLKISLHGKEKPASEFPVSYKHHENGTIIRISLKKKNKGGIKMDIQKLELKPDGHKFDSFSQIIVAAGKLLGKELEYGDVSCFSTANFAPVIQINESCTDWWHMNKNPAMDIVGKATGLKLEKLKYPKHNYTEWTDEEVDEWHGICAPVIKKELDQGKILITEGGWSNPKGKPFYPWCYWGIVTKVNPDGTITGIGVNNRDDNEMKWISHCWIVSVDEKEEGNLNQQLLERALTRIRGEKDPYLSDEHMAFGLKAMDIWIEKMKSEHFCDDCFASAPDREWTCADGSAKTMYQGAKDVVAFLGEYDYPESANSAINAATGHYTVIADLLEPELTKESDASYQSFIGNRKKQIEHAETVLKPVKEELAKAADEIEEILEGYRA